MLKSILDQISNDRIREHISRLEGVRHRTAAPDALEAAARYIEGEFGKLDYDLESPRFTYDGETFRNIIATRRGTADPDKRILIVAHYDTIAISPGADDNASGVAVLLELANVVNGLEFDRSIQFAAVNLEESQGTGTLTESGLQGSKALVEAVQAGGWQIEGAIVLESIAFAGKSIPQMSEGLPDLPTVGNFIAVVGNTASASLATGFEEAVTASGVELETFKLIVPGDGSMLPDTRRSDHARFWDAGYPSIMLTDTANFRNNNYHQTTDTLETLNIDFAAQVGRGVIAQIAGLAGVKK